MRFFKAFSILHRRTRSDSAITQDPPKAYVRPLSFSAGQNNDVFETFVPLRPLNTTIPANTPTTLIADRSSLVILDSRIRNLESQDAELKSTNKTPALLCERIHVLESEITELKRRSLPVALTTRIDELELEKRQLNSTIQVLLTTVTELSEDATKTRCDLHESHMHGIHLRRRAKEDEEEIERLEAKLAQYVKFTGMMVDIGLHEAVLYGACTALKAGEDADEALIDSIKEAAAKPGSPWSKVIPAVIGPRTSDEYLSAISMTLNLRRELKDANKVAKFWRRAAKETSEHAGTFTPSVSNISSIREQLSEERQTAVEDLLVKLRSGTYPRMLKRHANVDSELDTCSLEPVTVDASESVNVRHLSLTFSSSSDFTSTVRQNRHCPEPSLSGNGEGEGQGYEQGGSESRQSVTIWNSSSCFRDSASTIRGPCVSNLPPLASESFKEELAKSHSYKQASTSIRNSRSRTVLGEVDMNRNLDKSNVPASNSITSQGSKRSTKALEKRRAMVVTEGIESIQATYAPTRRASVAPPITDPIADPFAAALSKSLLVIDRVRQQKDDPRRTSNGSAAFDNSAFNNLIGHTTYIPCTRGGITFNTPSGSLESISENDETDENNLTLRSLKRISEESLPCGSSTLDLANAPNENSNRKKRTPGSTSRRHEHSENHFAPVNEPTSERTVIIPTPETSPIRAAEVSTPVKKSKLPVMKHLRRLSLSPVSVQATKTSQLQTKATITVPPVSAKKTVKVPLIKQLPSPSKTTPANSTSPSRLPFATGNANSRIADSGRKAVRRLSQMVSFTPT